MNKNHLLAPAIIDMVMQLDRADKFVKENYAERLEVNLKYIQEALSKYRAKRLDIFDKK